MYITVQVFDLSEEKTEKITNSYYEAFKASEQSENQSVLAQSGNNNLAIVEFWANKADMEHPDYAKAKGIGIFIFQIILIIL